MWEFHNNVIHTNAETRKEIYKKGIFKKIKAVKALAKFSMLLPRKERQFINMPIADL